MAKVNKDCEYRYIYTRPGSHLTLTEYRCDIDNNSCMDSAGSWAITDLSGCLCYKAIAEAKEQSQ